jgi:hypothetical protein
MQHALGWGFQRLAIAVGIVGICVVLAYVLLIFVILVGQGFTALGQ